MSGRISNLLNIVNAFLSILCVLLRDERAYIEGAHDRRSDEENWAAILSNLRAMFPHVPSLLMDIETLTEYRPLCVTGTGRPMDRAPSVGR